MRWPLKCHATLLKVCFTMTVEAARLISGRTPPVLTLAEAYVALVEAKNVGQLMRYLAAELPLGPLAHLKRVRKSSNSVEVLICLKQAAHQIASTAGPFQHGHATIAAAAAADQSVITATDQSSQQMLPGKTTQLLAACAAELKVERVPIIPPGNKNQWQEWSRMWPMPWRVPVGALEQDGEPASQPDQQYFEKQMAHAVAASKAANDRNVAIVVDPISGQVLAQAIDTSHQHPLDHAAMVAIEAVAARDRQLWPFSGFAHLGRHPDAPDSAGYDAISPHHPVAAANEATAAATETTKSRPHKKLKAQAQQQQQCCSAAALQADAVQASVWKEFAAYLAADRTSSNSTDVADGTTTDWASKPYLCTGFDCFVLHEPCTMCAMALLHSRLARVIYAIQDASHGALGGKYRLHAERSLNHHYKVYHMPLRQTAPGEHQ